MRTYQYSDLLVTTLADADIGNLEGGEILA